VGKGGIIRDPAVHRTVLEKVSQYAIGAGWQVRGLTRSPIQGQEGNVEFFIWLSQSQAGATLDVGANITRLVSQ
jgi:23S rRNA (cytidine1920-2'-O)/16S rRNA (cytidine1409-2'-O)-methyltransferase